MKLPGKTLFAAAWLLGALFFIQPPALGEDFALPVDLTGGRLPDAAWMKGDSVYEDPSIRVETHRIDNADSPFNATIYYAAIQIKDGSQIRTAAARDFTSKASVRASDIARRMHAVLAVNGDFYGVRPEAYVLRQGTVYRDTLGEDLDVLLIDEDGDFHVLPAKDNPAQKDKTTIGGKRVLNAFAFGPALIVDDQVVLDKAASPIMSAPDSRSQRMCLVQTGPKSYMVITCRTVGLTLDEMVTLVQSLTDHVEVAYMLDGGQSAQMVFMNRLVNKKERDARRVTDILYFASSYSHQPGGSTAFIPNTPAPSLAPSPVPSGTPMPSSAPLPPDRPADAVTDDAADAGNAATGDMAVSGNTATGDTVVSRNADTGDTVVSRNADTGDTAVSGNAVTDDTAVSGNAAAGDATASGNAAAGNKAASGNAAAGDAAASGNAVTDDTASSRNPAAGDTAVSEHAVTQDTAASGHAAAPAADDGAGNLSLYWGCMGVVSLLGVAGTGWTMHRKGAGMIAGVRTGLSALILSLILSRLGYMVQQLHYLTGAGSTFHLLRAAPGEFSVLGGCIGAVAGVWLEVVTGRPTHLRPTEALNALAPFGALLLGLVRLCAIPMGAEMLNWGNVLDNPIRIPALLTVTNSWGETYLAVYLLEAAAAFLTAGMAWLFLRKRTFLRTAFYLCLCQIFLESLRGDSLQWLFARTEQLLALLIALFILYRNGRRTASALPLTTGLACTLLLVLVEFALDKSDLPVAMLYGVMGAGLLLMAAAEIASSRDAAPAFSTEEPPAPAVSAKSS